MKVLLYNWVQFDDINLKGGGVSVYLNNIIQGMIEKGIEIFFVSCGQHYDLINRKIRIAPTKNIFGERVKSYRVYNSPVKAPAHDEFFSLDIARESKELKHLFSTFIKQNGPFDVFHIHN